MAGALLDKLSCVHSPILWSSLNYPTLQCLNLSYMEQLKVEHSVDGVECGLVLVICQSWPFSLMLICIAVFPWLLWTFFGNSLNTCDIETAFDSDTLFDNDKGFLHNESSKKPALCLRCT
jgi:hypothetical protein